jgi:uncharacterized protein
MVMPPSAETPALRPAPLLDWALLVMGIFVAALCIWFGPVLAGFVTVQSSWAAIAALYALIFAPMLLIAVGFSFAGKTSAFPIGDHALRWFGIGMLMGIGGLALTTGHAALAGSLVSGSGGLISIGLFVGMVIISFQVICEEVFFRGWMQTLLTRRIGGIAAVIITAILFSGFHILGGARSPLTLLNLLIGGIWFGLLAWRSTGLIAPIAAHLGWNISEQLLFGLDPNPGVGDFGSVGDWDMIGNPMWGGSEEGLNASIAMTFVLVALIIPLVWRKSPIAIAVPAPHPHGRAAV